MKWIDSILFNGDEIIKLRLEYLYNKVDFFYICEQRYTYQGTRKDELYIKKNFNWFTPYLSKIHFIVDEENIQEGSWDREYRHRNYSTQYIIENHKDEKYIISVCDCDEIPDISKIDKTDIYNICNNGALYMKQKLFYYNLNWHLGPWSRAFFLNNTILEQISNVQIWRDEKGPSVGSFECGWHLSYFMNKESIIRKIESFSHTECNSEKYKNIDNVYDCIKNGKFLFKDMMAVTITKYTEKDFPPEFYKFNDHIISLQE